MPIDQENEYRTEIELLVQLDIAQIPKAKNETFSIYVSSFFSLSLSIIVFLWYTFGYAMEQSICTHK